MKRNENGSTGWVVVGVAGLLLLPLVFWGLSVALAPMFGAGNAHKQTETANYRIANYERFKDNCNAIKALDGKIVLAEETYKADKDSGADDLVVRQSRLNLVALKNQRMEAANAYNADAQKSKTRAKFKDANLPAEINPTTFEGVTCP